MKKRYDIVSIGLMAYDMILRTVDESLFARDATLLEGLGVSSGGGAMTQAVIARRLGCRTALVGKVGGDSFGKNLMNILAEDGVDDTHVRVSPEDTTMVTIALVKPDGTRNFLTWEGSNNKTLCLADFDLSVVREARIVSYGSFFFLQSLDRSGSRIILEEAREHGAITVADAASDAFGQGRDTVLEKLPLLDYFIPSYDEATYLTGQKDYCKMADTFLNLGCGNVVIKLGKEGCYVRSREEGKKIETYGAVAVKDTTGAGDNFVGGFMAGLIDGMDIFSAARYANAVASVSVTGMGAVTAVKNKQQVLALMGCEEY